MLCRVANSVFWMSRYLERAENAARFIDVTSAIALGYRGRDEGLWSSLLLAGGDVENFQQRYTKATQANVTRFLLFDRENPNSVVSCLASARENARSIRENLTTPMWEAVNRFYLRVRAAAANSEQILAQPHPFLEQIKRSAHQVIGVTSATWSRGEAWQFSTMGYLLERADKTSRILDVKYFILHPDSEHLSVGVDVIQWGALLETTSALQMYRRTFGRIEPAKVVEFLVLNPRFPRSLRFCVWQAEDSLRAISGSPPQGFNNRAEQLLGQLSAQLSYARVSDILNDGLHEFVDDFQVRLNAVGEAVFDTFFQISGPERQSQQQRIIST
ncbi:MAG: alpha-E domain-containing protein [Planctomyces sp.]|nr:alpha-E domain-containing protein [Planctomyces sp.]